MAEETVYYRAKSIFNSSTLYFNVISLVLTVLGMTEFQKLLTPTQVATLSGTIIPIGNMVIRMFFTNRPVAFIAPGETKPVAVKKLD